MMVNLRGTSGAGKSTVFKNVVRQVRLAGGVVEPRFRDKRKQPWYYTGETPRPWRLLGHYETACGGCDTIKTVDEVYQLVSDGIERGQAVMYEGIMVQDDVNRAVRFHRDHGGMLVIALSTDIEECLEAVRSRREARGDTRRLNETNTRSRARSLQGTLRRLEQAGVPVERLDRDAAYNRVCELLGVPR